MTARVYLGATPLGGSQTLTTAAYPHEDVITVDVTGLSYADLLDLRVRVAAIRV